MLKVQNIICGKVIENFNKAVRIELRKWVKEQMEKVHYICQKCGKTRTELYVHHLHPLRDIILDTLNKK